MSLIATKLISHSVKSLHAVIFDNRSQGVNPWPFTNASAIEVFEKWTKNNNIKGYFILRDSVLFDDLSNATMAYVRFS